MITTGILTSDDPIELLAGLLVSQMPKKPSHRIATRLVREALDALIPAGWYVETQEPITLSDSEPEPDVAIIQGNTRDYQARHPNASEIALIVEVADSTLERDRSLKQRIYAGAGIPAYWILNLIDRQLEIYAQPTAEGYQSQTVVQQGEVPVLLQQNMIGTVALAALLPDPSPNLLP
jgi:Uma2 family endonuclease